MKKYYLTPLIFLFIFSIGFSSYLTDSLNSCYSLDESTGNTTYDYTNFNNGTVVNATLNQVGFINNAYYFNNSLNSSVDFNTLKFRQFSVGQNFTINVWLYINNITGTSQTIYSSYYNTQKLTVLYLDTSNKIVIDFAWGSGGYFNRYCHNVLNLSTWYLITVSNIGKIPAYASTRNGYTKIFINGIECSSYTQSQLYVYWYDDGTTMTNNIGTNKKTGSKQEYFDGKMDTLMIFNTTLNQTHITQLYNNRYGLSCDMNTPLINNNVTKINDNNINKLYQYMGTYILNITTLNESNISVNNGLNIKINNLSLNYNVSSIPLQNILYNNVSSNFYLINITNMFNVSVNLITNRTTYRLLTNTSFSEVITNKPLSIEYNITMVIYDNSIENLTKSINISVKNLNTSIQRYFNLTRVNMVNCGEDLPIQEKDCNSVNFINISGGYSYGNYVFQPDDVGSYLNFSYTLKEYDSYYNSTIILDTHGFTYFYFMYYLQTFQTNIQTFITNSLTPITNLLNNITVLINNVNSSLYNKMNTLSFNTSSLNDLITNVNSSIMYKLDNLNISGGSVNISNFDNVINNLTSLINSVNNSLYLDLSELIINVNDSLINKLDNLNISGGSFNQSDIDNIIINITNTIINFNTSVNKRFEVLETDISLIKRIQICYFKQYETIDDYYNYCLDYSDRYNLTVLQDYSNQELNITAYFVNKSLSEWETKPLDESNCYDLEKYKRLLNITDYFVLNAFLTASSISIDSAYCWLKLGFKTIASVKV
jgi:hypothetical protein